MPQTNKFLPNMAGGEISPSAYGRTDLQVFQKSLAKCQNFIPLPSGGARFRNGTQYVKNTLGNKTARLIPFQYSGTGQSDFVLELTDQAMRFYTEQGAVLSATVKTITNITSASPAVVTAAGHGYSNGDEVYIAGPIVGLTGVAGKFYIVANATTDTFSLEDIDGTTIDTTNNGVYQSGGTADKVYGITTPYTEANLAALNYAQETDTMRIVSQSYFPRKLVRTSNTSWAVNTISFANASNPFGDAVTGTTSWPAAVVISNGRVIYGGTIDKPETIWASKMPSSGANNYDDMTVGTNDTDGLAFPLSPVTGKINPIRWFATTSKVIMIGGPGGLRMMFGGAIDEAITPSAIEVKPVNVFGADPARPISNGEDMFYVQRGGAYIRSLAYDFYLSGYQTKDRTFLAEHLTKPSPIVQIIEQRGSINQGMPDCIWALRADGVLLGSVYKPEEQIFSWHQQYIGGQSRNANNQLVPFGKVLSICNLPRANGGEQLWLVVEREINGNTVRTVEFVLDEPVYPEKHDFYTGGANETADTLAYENVEYEVQKTAGHLDMSTSYDGSALGLAGNISLTISATTGDTIDIRSNIITGTILVPIITPTAFFDSTMVGHEIWKRCDAQGQGIGRAVITAFIDSTRVQAKVVDDFDNADPIKPGFWYLTTNVLSSLRHFEGQTVQVCIDGGPAEDMQVQNGVVQLDSECSYAIAGLKYTGRLETLNIDSGGVSGSAEAKLRNIYETDLRFRHSAGAVFGTDEYSTIDLFYYDQPTLLDRPAKLFDGILRTAYSDGWAFDGKRGVLIQERAMPCTLLSWDFHMDTTDE